MTTRFYLARTTAAPVSPAFDAAWTSTGSAVRRALLRDYDGSALTNGSTISWTSGQVALDRQYVSPPLSAQTLTGNVRMQLRARELASTDNVRPYLGIHVFSEDGTTYRATLLAVGFYNSTITELSTTQTNTAFADGDALTPYTCVDGDRVVVEIGYSDVAGTTPQALARYGAPAGPDFGENNTDTSDLAPWVEFHTSLEFRPVLGVANQTLEWSYGAKAATSRIVWGSPNQTLEWSYGAQHYGPFVRNMSPSACGCCVTATDTVSFQVGTVLPTTVALSTLVITFIINGVSTPVYAGGFQPGFSGTITDVSTAFEDLHDIEVMGDLPGGAAIEIVVEVEDSLAVAMAPPVSWCFCVAAAIFYVLEPDVVDRDGGYRVTLTSNGLPDGLYVIRTDGAVAASGSQAMYSGLSGQGAIVEAKDGQVTFVTRALPVGGPYPFFIERVTGSGAPEQTTPALLYVLPRQFESSLLALRRLLPAKYKLGVREAAHEPFPQ